MSKSTGTLISILLAATCAATKPTYPNRYRDDDGTLVVCTLETDTGSNRRVEVCRRVEGSDTDILDRDSTDKLVNGPQTGKFGDR